MYKQNPSLGKGVDWITIMLYIILVVFGLVCIISVEYKPGVDFWGSLVGLKTNYSRQFFFIGISSVVAVLILLTDSKFFTATPNILYLLGILLMLATFVLGKDVNGSRSWIPLGFFNLQPVETCKIFTALAVAKFLAQPEMDYSKAKNQLIAAAIAFLPIVISLLQNETGLALVYFAFLIPMYREGLPGVYLVSGASLGILLVVTLLFSTQSLLIVFTALALLTVYFYRRKIKRNKSLLLIIFAVWGFCTLFVGFIVPYIFTNVFQKYQADRIFSLVGRDNPFIEENTHELTPEELKKKKVGAGAENYNVKQSKIAIGSGGVAGKGFLKGTQTQGDFVPEQHTDFIFTAVGENFGFVGSALLMILYLTFLLRLIYLAERQRSTFSRVYIYSVAGFLFFHVSINICMTIGLAPVIGITLPLLSYGGSSLLTFTILIFILIRLDADRQMVLR